jgi:hypothetical protein
MPVACAVKIVVSEEEISPGKTDSKSGIARGTLTVECALARSWVLVAGRVRLRKCALVREG